MAILRNIVIKGLLPGAGAAASSAGAWKVYTGLSPVEAVDNKPKSVVVAPSYVPASDLLTIKEENGKRTDNPITGGCFAKYFPGVDISWDKDESTQETIASPDNTTYAPGKEDVEACFLVDMKYRDTDKQKAITLGAELTLIKGNHGLAIWSTLNNMAKNELLETIYVVRLSKDDAGKWKIEKGYSWISYGQNSGQGFNKLEVYFDNAKVSELNTSSPSACLGVVNTGSSIKKCDLFTASSTPTKTFKYSGFFRSDDKGTERIFSKLKTKDEIAQPDFWGNEDIFDSKIAKYRGFMELSYAFADNKWKKGKTGTGHTEPHLKTSLVSWFKPFMESKGKWDGTKQPA